MTDFKAKIHQIRFRLVLRPRPAGGANSAPPDPLAGLRGPTSKGGGVEGGGGGKVGRGGQERGGERRGAGEKGRGRSSPQC